MASKSIAGLYSSQAVLKVIESASNTLTFDKLETGLSVYDKVGWVISRIEWRLSQPSIVLFNGTGDNLKMALTASNQLTALADDDPAIYTVRTLLRTDYGTAANADLRMLLWVDDFSTLPGGGLLMLPNPLYIGAVGSGLSGPATVYARIFFQGIDMADQDYFNLVQARQLLVQS